MVLEQITLKDLIDFGTSGMLVFFLWQLWQRLNYVTDVMIEDRKQAAAEREIIAQANGVSPEELQQRARLIRLPGEKHG